MAKSSSWQEEGTQIGGKLLREDDASKVIEIVRERVKDPAILAEIEAFLSKGEPLSEMTRDTLQLVILGIMMQWKDLHED